MTRSNLSDLTRYGWSVPILAAIADGTVARSGPLVSKTGGSRGGVEKAIQGLIDLKVMRRNPGHGHPLRPEFMLTEFGKPLAEGARLLYREAYAMNAENLIRKRWALPVVRTLENHSTFSGLRRVLSPITDRALSLSLKDLDGHRLISRKVKDGNPPVPEYTLTRRGRKLVQRVKGLE